MSSKSPFLLCIPKASECCRIYSSKKRLEKNEMKNSTPEQHCYISSSLKDAMLYKMINWSLRDIYKSNSGLISLPTKFLRTLGWSRWGLGVGVVTALVATVSYRTENAIHNNGLSYLNHCHLHGDQRRSLLMILLHSHQSA